MTDSTHALADLLPCPFCGKPPATDNDHWVWCEPCDIGLPELDWNTRTALRVPNQQVEAVAWRWRQPGNKHWIYDPTPEWIEDHKNEIELEPLYASPPSPQETRRALEPTEAQIEAAWQAFGDCPIDLCGDSDDEQKRCVVAALKAALSTSPAPAEDYPFFECPGCGRDIAESGTVCAPNCPRAAEDVRALEKIANQISAKVVQLEHYRDNGCQLDHARTIAEGRILQGIQILRWVTEALTIPWWIMIPLHRTTAVDDALVRSSRTQGLWTAAREMREHGEQ